MFSYKELVVATNNFSMENKLGDRGFGAIYKGLIVDSDLEIPVKEISRSSRQNFSSNSLSLNERYKIALGLASLLLYCHEECENCVVHRDIKSSNMMLDSNSNAKLGDFGMTKLIDHDVGSQSIGLVGKLSYMSPEYIATCRASKEHDVYSFGVVALEFATGKKALHAMRDKNGEEKRMVEWVWSHYDKGELLEVVDERLEKDYDEKQAQCLVIVGMSCTHLGRNLRFSMRQVVQGLCFEASLP
ncbi:hypothetical protein JHK87_022615 [Glycine soja]|nr:hypothetical protein JHK87_022615 [Glycine soja]